MSGNDNNSDNDNDTDIDVKWEFQERGWYTSTLGGVVQNASKRHWFWYPADGRSPIGPYPSMRRAMRAAED